MNLHYELKFLKTYLNAYLKNGLQIDRTDSWVLDGIRYFAMMQYIEKIIPKVKCLVVPRVLSS
jgi:hypothetical protein